MMRDHEVEILVTLLRARRPKVCLEWGSGGSTLFFPEEVDSVVNWIAIEHNRQWYSHVQKTVQKSPIVDLRIHPDLTTYPDAPRELDTFFDFILVDGRERRRCVAAASKLSAPGG